MRRVSTIPRWRGVLAWAVLILAMSTVPGSRLDEAGLRVPDKLVHAGEYGVLGALAGWAATGGGSTARRAAAVAILAGALLGAVDENYQRLIPQRDPSLADWGADLLGAAAGALFSVSRFGRALRPGRKSG